MNNGFYNFPSTDKSTGLSIDTSSFATTGSNQFSGSQTITGSLNVTQGITGSFSGTASFAISSSLATSSSFAVSSSRAISSSFATSASFAATASYSRNLQISGSINNVDYIDFNTGSVVTQPIAGRISWNDTDGTLNIGLKGNNVTLQVGQEEVLRVINKTGGNLLEADYRVVRVRSVAEGGAQGQRLAVVLAQGDNDDNSATTLGIVTENIDNNEEGFITTFGKVRGIDTTGTLQGETWEDGDMIYLSPTTPGFITKIKPQAPQHSVILGYVIYTHANNGIIFVKVDNGYEIDELHNVRIDTGSLTSGQLLVRSGSVWTNSTQLTGSYELTGSLNATSFTGSLSGTASFAQTALVAPNYLPLTGGTIVGSLTINNNLTVLGSASIQYISESVLNIGTNIITVNTTNPGARFGGLSIIDSGSSPQVSASFLYDSVHDEFIFVHRGTSASAITSSHFIVGPETYNDLGNELYLTANRIPKSVGNEHLNNSNISDNGSVVSINSNTQITGSVVIKDSGTNISLGSNIGIEITSPSSGASITSQQGLALMVAGGSNGNNIATFKSDNTNETLAYISTNGSIFTTGSIIATQGITGSFSGSGINLNSIPASAITGLNLSQIATGSVTASVSPTQFSVISGSTTEFIVTGTGVTLGSVSTDIHTVTGSLSVSQGITGSLFGTASFAQTASFAINAQPASTRRNANNSSNNNINYNGVALGTAVSESATVWTIKRLSISANGNITIATATNVAWINRESATYI